MGFKYKKGKITDYDTGDINSKMWIFLFGLLQFLEKHKKKVGTCKMK